jgi:2,4-dienoyl-CoA reductase-like NADH-dependent reductase (Old Yellow Enzyme family)
MLFDSWSLRELRFRNRIFVSPMCQYSAKNGVPSDWHLVHLGSRAVGGAALVIAEATGVSAAGRISPGDTGLWNDEQEKAFARIATFVKEQGARAGIQLAHAGRKGSTHVPWTKNGAPLQSGEGAWITEGPSPQAFGDYPPPRELNLAEIKRITQEFTQSAERAHRAGFDVVELHFAHGYLLHEFLSPLSNHREDNYGGSLENRMRFSLEIARAVRAVWPSEKPLFARISASDWVEGGWDVTQSVALARELKTAGVDLVDCSSGGNVPKAPIPNTPGYQVPFAEQVRREAGIPTGAVGLITEAKQAEEILVKGQADAIFLARAMLRDPYWPLSAARELGVNVDWPKQYDRAKPKLAVG